VRIFVKLTNILALSVPDEGYSRNASCTLNLISTFFITQKKNEQTLCLHITIYWMKRHIIHYKHKFDWKIVWFWHMKHFKCWKYRNCTNFYKDFISNIKIQKLQNCQALSFVGEIDIFQMLNLTRRASSNL
jgi:hypothetical protein